MIKYMIIKEKKWLYIYDYTFINMIIYMINIYIYDLWLLYVYDCKYIYI